MNKLNKYLTLSVLVISMGMINQTTISKAADVGVYDTKGEATFIGDPYEFPQEPEDPSEPGEKPTPKPTPETPNNPKRPNYPQSGSNGSVDGGRDYSSGSSVGGRTSSGSTGGTRSIIPRTGDQPWYIATIQGSLILSLMGIMIIKYKKIR